MKPLVVIICVLTLCLFQESLSFLPRPVSLVLFGKGVPTQRSLVVRTEPKQSLPYGDGLLADASEGPLRMKKQIGEDPLAFLYFGGNGITNYSIYKSFLEQLQHKEVLADVPEDPPPPEETEKSKLEELYSLINPFSFLFSGGQGFVSYSMYKSLFDQVPVSGYVQPIVKHINKQQEEARVEKKRSSYPLPKRIALRHTEGWGAGINYGTNYSSLDILFAPDYRIGHTLAMVDLRGHRFDNNTYAANLGVIARYIPDSFCELLGANVYYDYRQGSIGHFHQMGVGVEILNKRWDFRANAYIPITAKHICQCLFDDYAGGFFIKERRIETISYGYNAEIGYLAARTNTFLLYLAAGPYYMTGRRCHEKTRGVKVRMRPQYKDYIALDLSATHDPVFETVYQAMVIISLPFYQITGQNKKHCGVTDRQIYQPVERFEVMPIGKCHCWKTNF